MLVGDTIEKELRDVGYLQRPVDPALDLFEEIKKLKKEKMRSSLHITIRMMIFRMWPITAATALD